MSYGTFTLTGHHTTPSGKPHAGSVVITPNTIIRDTAGDIVLSGAEQVKLDAEGAWSIVLPCDSAGLNPASGIGYTIGYSLRSTSMPQPSFYATADLAGSTLDVSDIVSVSVPTPLSAIVGPEGPEGPAGSDGLKGDPGDSFLTLDPDGTPKTLAGQRLVTEATITRRAGAGAYTPGDVLKLGTNAYNTRADTGTGIVAGGAPNNENVVGGNLANVDTGTSNLDGAPTLTNENGNWNFLLGGYDTVVNGWANSVVGFHCKVGVDANHCTIAGGSRHSIAASSVYGSVGGGTGHIVSGASVTIAGGTTNTATGNNSAVGGGNNNNVSASAATISGGSTNTAAGANSSVAGGNSNSATGSSSTVGGGLTNTSTGLGATVPGGRSNAAYGDYSTGIGYGTIVTQYGEFARGTNFFANPGDAQSSWVQLFRQTTDATAADLRINNASPPQCPENTTWAVRVTVVARRTDVAGESASWRVEGTYKRDVGNTAAWVGTPTVTSLGANAGNAWTVTTGSFSTGNSRIIVTGEAAKTIRWVAQFEVVQVQQAATATRANSTAYTLGQRALNGAAVLQCVIAGTTGASTPTNPAAGAAVTDGTVTWLRTF